MFQKVLMLEFTESQIGILGDEIKPFAIIMIAYSENRRRLTMGCGKPKPRPR
jgi:hypothetical protein